MNINNPMSKKVTELKQKIVDKYPERDIKFTSKPASACFVNILDIRVKTSKDQVKKINLRPPLVQNSGFFKIEKPIVLEKGQVITHRQVIKKPWFHNAFMAILKVNPDFTEKEMIGEEIYYDDDGRVNSYWNTNVVEDIVYEETFIKDTVDPNHVYIHFSIYDTLIEKYGDTILKDIDILLA